MSISGIATTKYSLLSQENNLNASDPKLKYLAQAKAELFDTFVQDTNVTTQLNNSLINQKTLIEEIRKNREGQKTALPFGKIQLRGEPNAIATDLNKYNEFLRPYTKLFKETNTPTLQQLAECDRFLANRIILQNGGSIEFKAGDYPNIDEESKKNFEKLAKIRIFENKIERIQKTDSANNNYYIIQWTKEQWNEIKKRADVLEKTMESSKPKNTPTTIVETKESKEIFRLGLLVNRDHTAEQLKNIRTNKDIIRENETIELCPGYSVKIGDQKDYSEFLRKYLHTDNEEALKNLDSEFAERIILDNKKWIQIDNQGVNNKSADKLLKEATDCVDALNKLGYDLEFVRVAELGKEDHYVIRPKKEDKLNENPTEFKKKKLSATISNVEDVHMEEANFRVEELARADYEKLGSLSLWKANTRHPWERMKTYMLRSVRRQQRRDKHMAAIKGTINLTREDVVHASDRHENEFDDTTWTSLAGKNINRVMRDHHNDHIDILCRNYISSGTMDDRTFENEFNRILRSDPTVMRIIGNNNLEYLASNILFKLKAEKADVFLVDGIANAVAAYNPETFGGEIEKLAKKYFAETKKNFPPYLQKILDQANNPTEINRIINHQKARLHAELNNLEIQLQLLDNTTGAYEINNKDKDKGFRYKFGHWMDEHPYLTLGGSVLAGAGILATGGALGGVAGAVASTGLMAAKIGGITAAKKASHYTKEQKGQEKRLTHDLNVEQQAMENIKTVMNNAPRYSWRKYKAKRQFELYQESTQKNIGDTARLTDFINQFLGIPGALSPAQQGSLTMYLENALARVDYYKESGHNFVASQNRTKLETDFRNLYTAIIEGSKKIGTNIATLRTSSGYTTLHGELMTDYDKATSNFRAERRGLEWKYGVGAGLLYAGSSLGLQYVLGSGVFGNHPVGGTTTVVTPNGTTITGLHDEVKTALQHAGASQDNIAHIEKALETAQSSSPNAAGYNQQAWRTIVKGEMKWDDTQLNSWMNDFMKTTLWNLNENGASEFKTQLLNAKLSILNANSPQVELANTFLSSPKIGILQPGDGPTVLKNLQDWIGGKSLSAFSDTDKIKMGYFGHMFIHDDSGTGSALTQELLKSSTIAGKPPVPPVGIINNHHWFDGVGMPVFANTFMERMTPKKDEKGQLIEQNILDPVPDPTLIIADKNNPAQPGGSSMPSWLTTP